MDQIPIFEITKITEDKIYYRNNYGNIASIELELCAKNFKNTYKCDYDRSIKFRCVGERSFGKYSYYELYTESHI